MNNIVWKMRPQNRVLGVRIGAHGSESRCESGWIRNSCFFVSKFANIYFQMWRQYRNHSIITRTTPAAVHLTNAACYQTTFWFRSRSLWCGLSGGVTGPIYVPWPGQTADYTRVSHNSWWLTINSWLAVSVFSQYFMTNIAKPLSLLHHSSSHFCRLNCCRSSFTVGLNGIFPIWSWLLLCFILSP